MGKYIPKVTVITVNLNNIEGLLYTIKSVIGQTYTDKEYIIIDGASTDGSVDVIKEDAGRINYWLSEPDSGIYDAMNKGIKLANGEWIIFMNSGDKFHNNRTLEIIFKDKKFENIDVIYGNTLYKDIDRLLIAPSKITKRYFFKDTLCHQSIFTNQRSFKKIGGYNLGYKFISDREWLLRAKISNMNFYFVNEIVSQWDPKGFCNDNPVLILREVQRMQKKYFNILESNLMIIHKKASSFLKR